VKVDAFEVGPFLARCLLVVDEASREAALVDPGLDVEVVLDAVADRDVTVTSLVLTHAHLDHAAGVAEARRSWPDAPLLLHADDLPLYGNLPMQARMFGFPPPEPVPHDRLIGEGDTVRVGGGVLRVRHCPGHSPGHVVLLGDDGGAPFALVGDVLFAGSVGRTDLWGGSWDQLERSIRDVLYRLPDATRVVPGHGPDTTIGEERRHNPFVTG